ncbi:MFS general substrate transporter [Phellopilus nigrolimitatus]|nr:MFS general substrate transporter [Phellopilus nigrolimitatus]
MATSTPLEHSAELESSASSIRRRPQPQSLLLDSASSQSSHAQPFQQGLDIFNLPEEPVAEETVEAFHDELVGDGQGAEDEEEDMKEDKRPWYRKPSPWWMLTLMPISAMALAGVSPSLLQIYTDLVCEAINNPATATFQEVHASVLPASLQSEGNSMLADMNCASDPKVQAAVSKLVAALTATLGILSCITGASWASLSDRLGRRPVLAIASSAVIISYSILTCVYFFADHLPGGYWFFIVGPTIHGLLGGTAAASAATSAYIADCTPALARARMFSLTLGLRFTGMAVGPTLCALIVRFTGTPVAAAVLVVVIHAAYLALVLFVVPESLSAEQIIENRRAWREARSTAVVTGEGEDTGSRVAKAREVIGSLVGYVFAFLRPLSVVRPIAVTSASGRIHKDWSLTYITISSGLASLILASYSSMFQFGAATFGWTAIELGYWFSGIVAARALTLTLILPILIKIYHHYKVSKPQASGALSFADAESSDRAPLLAPQSSDFNTSSPVSPTQPRSRSQSRPPRHNTPAFDLAIAQASLALEVVCYALVPVLMTRWRARMKPAYIVLTILASCGAGFGPAIQSLAVDLYAGRGGTETGRLFGVLSVVQATSSQILGPTVYGLTYMKIVAVYPQGIFFVSVGAVTSALLALLFVELPGSRKTALHDEEGEIS